jgi:hypothetical protein
MLTLLVLLFISVISGICYRLGGAGKSGQWYDFLLNTKARDAGCSLLTTLAIGIQIHWIGPWWIYLAHFGLLWLALSTYWDFLNKDREVWYTWLITGLGYGLPCLLFCFYGLSVGLVLLRCLVLAVFTCIWRITWTKDVVEEVGSGVSLPLTVTIL